MPLAAVTLKEIEGIFEILDRLGISREAVVVPLGTVHPGGVRVLPNGKLEIRVESEGDFAAWLPVLETKIRELLAHGGAKA
jgi:hypothetical protein